MMLKQQYNIDLQSCGLISLTQFNQFMFITSLLLSDINFVWTLGIPLTPIIPTYYIIFNDISQNINQKH